MSTQLSVWFSRIPFVTGAVLVACCGISLLSLLVRFGAYQNVCLQPFFVVYAGESARPPASVRLPRCARVRDAAHTSATRARAIV